MRHVGGVGSGRELASVVGVVPDLGDLRLHARRCQRSSRAASLSASIPGSRVVDRSVILAPIDPFCTRRGRVA